MEADILEARLKNLVKDKKQVDIFVIRPLQELPPETLEFNPEKIEAAIHIGLKSPILRDIQVKPMRSGFSIEIQGDNFDPSKGKVFINRSEINMTHSDETRIMLNISENLPSNFNLLTVQNSQGTIEMNLEVPLSSSV